MEARGSPANVPPVKRKRKRKHAGSKAKALVTPSSSSCVPSGPPEPEAKKQRTQVPAGHAQEQAHELDESHLEVTIVGCSAADGQEAMDSFTDCTALQAKDGILLKNITVKSEYKKPTAVQRHAIPILMSGRDLVGCARTGSGKTAAFLVPIIASLISDDKRKGEPPGVGWRHTYRAYPLVIILAPTRELAIQIYQEALKFADSTTAKVAMVYGGTSYVAQSRLLEKNGSDILVATPGRLKDMVERDKISLRQVCYLVLDEADRMLDMGFEPDIRYLVEKQDMPKERQTMLFSATFPDSIKRLATDFLRKDFVTLSVGREGSTNETIKQVIKLVKNEKEKLSMLKQELQVRKEDEQVIVFVETKQEVPHVGDYLKREGIEVAILHGDMEQKEREVSLKRFRAGHSKVLVGTSVAARGLDIHKVARVINFDMPNTIEHYIHRIGRTGRAGHEGTAIAFFFPQRDGERAPDLVKLLEDSKQEVPDWLRTTANQPKNKKQRNKEKFKAVLKQRKQMAQHSGERGRKTVG